MKKNTKQHWLNVESAISPKKVESTNNVWKIDFDGTQQLTFIHSYFITIITMFRTLYIHKKMNWKEH